MKTNSNEPIITHKIVWLRQFFVCVTFLLLSEVLVVFNISSPHANTNMLNTFFAWTILSM